MATTVAVAGCQEDDRGLGATQRRVGFEITLPCWVPEGVRRVPRVGIASGDNPGGVLIDYSAPGTVAALSIEEDAVTSRTPVVTGPTHRIADTDVVIQELPGGGTTLDWRRSGVRFLVASSFGASETLEVAEALIVGCAQGSG